MKTKEVLEVAREVLPDLLRRYWLTDWWVSVEVSGEGELSDPTHLAEVHLEEPYRVATIRVNRARLPHLTPEVLQNALEHEVQHLTSWWLWELRDLVMAALPEEEEGTARVLEAAFVRAMELHRSLLGRLTGRGNTWEDGSEVSS